MPEAVPLHLVVAHLDHELRPHRRLLEAAAPPAVLLGEAALGRPGEQWLHQREDLLLAARGDGARADVVEPPVVLVEPEQERRERGRLRLPADADDDAVRRPVLLHLLHRLARAGEVRRVEPLRDHAVEADRVEPGEPFPRLLRIARGRRHVERQLLDARAPLRERLLPDGRALPEQHVEADEAGRRLGGELADAALGRMEAHLQEVELEPPACSITISPSSAEWGGRRSPSSRSSGK